MFVYASNFLCEVPMFVAICLSLSTPTERCLLILMGWHDLVVPKMEKLNQPQELGSKPRQ